MQFNSLAFAVFLPIVFAIYWLLNRQLKWQNLFVVAASYVFYGWWDWRFLFLIAFTSLCSWVSGLYINRYNAQASDCCTQESAARRSWAKWILSANIVINLLILGIFKYFNFFVDSFCQLFGIANNLVLQLILPVGISFYTFQALSYSIDVYRKRITPTHDIVAFFAYVSFFPQLVAGPIERATNLLPQFERPRTFDYEEGKEGLRRILWGLFKKLVIADNCATYVDYVWANYRTESSSTLVLAAILFAFQIYGDFSGYSDIAIGTARLFGIRLKDNFLVPYFSRNVAEFWKRWHISLNTWFVDYVYIPLGGSRGSRWTTIRNTFIIFLLSGLWHGANWTYVTWGAYHALLFVPLIFLGRTKKYSTTATWKQIPKIGLTFALVTLGWIIFRAPNIEAAWLYIRYIFSPSLLTIPYVVDIKFYVPMACSLIILIFVEWVNREKGTFSLHLPRALRWVVYLALGSMIYIFGNLSYNQFIYFQF